MTSKVVTMQQLKEELSSLENSLETRLNLHIDRKFEKQKFEIQDMLQELKSEFFNKVDPFLGEMVDNRDHRAIATKDKRELQEIVEDHTKRIAKLEQKHAVA